MVYFLFVVLLSSDVSGLPGLRLNNIARDVLLGSPEIGPLSIAPAPAPTIGNIGLSQLAPACSPGDPSCGLMMAGSLPVPGMTANGANPFTLAPGPFQTGTPLETETKTRTRTSTDISTNAASSTATALAGQVGSSSTNPAVRSSEPASPTASGSRRPSSTSITSAGIFDNPSENATKMTPSQTSAIVGGTVGGSMALLAVFGLAFLANIRSRRRRAEMLSDDEFRKIEDIPPIPSSWSVRRKTIENGENYMAQSGSVLTNPFADPVVDNRYPPPPLPQFSTIRGDGRLSHLSLSSQIGSQAPLPTLEEETSWPPEPPITPPPVILRGQLQGEGSINDRSVESLPENLGKLSSWLKENRRRSRMGSAEFEDDDDILSIRHSLGSDIGTAR
jgi:hypothetical protein